jgi:hypothetical protein
MGLPDPGPLTAQPGDQQLHVHEVLWVALRGGVAELVVRGDADPPFASELEAQGQRLLAAVAGDKASAV